MSKRETVLLGIFGALLAWQCATFTYGIHLCASTKRSPDVHPCPNLGDRYQRFVESSTAAVLGLLAGSAVQKGSRNRPE